MRYRLTFVAGVAVGYVLGTRAGRERYEQLRKNARRIAENPAVRNAYESAAHNGWEMTTRAFSTVSEQVGERLPSTVSEKVRALRERRNGRTPASSDWSSNGT
ncbi:MAG TPA: YtxH domain-containing protein [Streptomyces sp.]|nr:YtxH domain-containing protein [Streptomyces sp.]